MPKMAHETLELPERAIEANNGREKFRDLIDAAVSEGTRVMITRSGKPVAAVIPLRDLKRLQASDAAMDRQMIAKWIMQVTR